MIFMDRRMRAGQLRGRCFKLGKSLRPHHFLRRRCHSRKEEGKDVSLTGIKRKEMPERRRVWETDEKREETLFLQKGRHAHIEAKEMRRQLENGGLMALGKSRHRIAKVTWIATIQQRQTSLII